MDFTEIIGEYKETMEQLQKKIDALQAQIEGTRSLELKRKLRKQQGLIRRMLYESSVAVRDMNAYADKK